MTIRYSLMRVINLISKGRNAVVIGKNKILRKYFLEDGVKIKEEIDIYNNVEDVVRSLSISPIESYIIFTSDSWSNRLEMLLTSNGFNLDCDVIFVNHKPIVVSKTDCSRTPYYDHYGNYIKGNLKESKVTIKGWDSKFVVSGNTKLDITLHNESIVTVDDCVLLGLNIICEHQASIIISKSYIESQSTIIAHIRSSIKIGPKTHILKYATLVAHNDLIIGEDCLISKYCVIQSGDGHTIFDLSTSKPIDSLKKDYTPGIIINNHVWIGVRVTLLDSTIIGKGSVVGAQSVTKGRYPNNCSIGGAIAKVLCKNIAWSRNKSTDIKDCAGYTSLTSE